MRVNKDHPDYPAYAKKHNEIWERKCGKIKHLELTNNGMDGEDDRIRRELIEEIKKLQKEYSFLFVENNK